MWRQSFLAEYFYEDNFNTPTLVGIRTVDARFVQYPSHPEWTEVFDLDSYEMKNLAADPARRDAQARLAAEFAAQVKATGYLVPENSDQPGTKSGERKAKAKGKKKAGGAVTPE